MNTDPQLSSPDIREINYELPYELYKSTRKYDQDAYEWERANIWTKKVSPMNPSESKFLFIKTFHTHAAVRSLDFQKSGVSRLAVRQ